MSERRWRTLKTEVLCEYHGEVHRKEEDHYQMGEAECSAANWRNIAALGTAEELDGY